VNSPGFGLVAQGRFFIVCTALLFRMPLPVFDTPLQFESDMENVKTLVREHRCGREGRRPGMSKRW